MHSINLHLEELGPWAKLTTPPITPMRKILPLTVGGAFHKRANTSILSQGKYELNLNTTQYYTFSSYLQEHAATHLPAVELINQYYPAKNWKTQEKNEKIKIFTVDDLKSKDLEYESQHINHKYFPYRLSGNQMIMKSFKPGSPKNTFTYKVKKAKPHSCEPISKKSFIFWNQRKLVANQNHRKMKNLRVEVGISVN